MPARALSSATISFGLVSIPVKLYASASQKQVRFNMLHAADKGRLKQQLLCSTCGEVVSRDETVKGYEYSRGQYVVLEDEELKALEKRSDRTISIEEFIPIESVDPVYFDKANLLGPDKGGHKAYRLLRAAMDKSGRVAVGRFATRGREQLVLLRPTDRGLVLHGLMHADEVRSFEDIELGEDVSVKDSELALADQLIEQLSHEEFEPEKYEDEYRKSALAAIDRKVAGEEIFEVPDAEPREQIIDLVAALKKSLGESGRSKKASSSGTRKAAKSKGRKKSASRKTATS